MNVRQLQMALAHLDDDVEVWVENAETGPGPMSEFIPGWGPDGQVMIR